MSGQRISAKHQLDSDRLIMARYDYQLWVHEDDY
jgi:hypothetical protein